MIGETNTRALTLEDSAILAHALTGWIASSAGVRALAIKGPVAEHYQLRDPWVSADADILVEPSRFQVFCRELEARGWRQRVARPTPSILESHSTTYIHPDWPCDIDVHNSFPGFFEDPSVVFDELWCKRGTMVVANVAITIPSRPASAAIGALHALRNLSVPRHQRELAFVTRAIVEAFTDGERSEFLELARRGRSLWVLTDIIEIIAPGGTRVDVTPEQMRVWVTNLKYGADGSAVGWLMAASVGSLRQRVATLAAAIWVPRDQIPRNDPAVVPTRRDAWAHQLIRWRRGARALGRYLAGQARRGS
ncbi:nucleotidyltransferase family protein [Microbacterium hydrocarbonoxydans]|uniref:nucleotidyltransferase family protein n=1 Tax=Microbacterium hydrocarbonoxydans TaxID=273678 RepID=UPI0013DAFBA5|nr:nucleotidyltransferase family protein [Microbacterium hydrocarbonoxydans]